MKKKIALLLAVITLIASMFALAGCNKQPAADEGKDAAAQTDLDYVKEKGKLVIGVTEFEPMDYKDEKTGEWAGFDADMARAFAKSLGVEAEITPIEWNTKVLELQNKSIDCVWNGMTLTDEVKAAMNCSKAYCDNAQVVIVNKDGADKYKTAEDCKALNFAVEKGSAGEEQAEANGFKFTAVDNQAKTLLEVKSGNCDAAIIDSLMAGAMIGEGTDYADLVATVALNSEKYGVGFRKDSNLADELNKFFDASLADGSMEKVAEQYGVQAALIK